MIYILNRFISFLFVCMICMLSVGIHDASAGPFSTNNECAASVQASGYGGGEIYVDNKIYKVSDEYGQLTNRCAPCPDHQRLVPEKYGVASCSLSNGLTCATNWQREMRNYSFRTVGSSSSSCRSSYEPSTDRASTFQQNCEIVETHLEWDDDNGEYITVQGGAMPCVYASFSYSNQTYQTRVCLGSTEQARPINYCSCGTSGTNTYYGLENSDYGPTCHSCNSGNGTCTGDGSAGNPYTFICDKNYTYKTAYQTRTATTQYFYNTSTYNPEKYGQYYCMLCPNISNYSAMGLSYDSVSYLANDNNRGLNFRNPTGDLWARCVATTKQAISRTETVDGKSVSVKYTLNNIKPTNDCPANCFNNTDELPDTSNLQTSNCYCDYSYNKKYTSVAEGYGAKNNDTQSASIEKCGNGYYSTDNDIVCKALPPNSTVVTKTKGDVVLNVGFKCDAGAFKLGDTGDTCILCPQMTNSSPHGSTDASGANTVTACYVSGGSSITKASGVYYGGNKCYFNGSFYGAYVLKMKSSVVSQNKTKCIDSIMHHLERINHYDNQHGQAALSAEALYNAAIGNDDSTDYCYYDDGCGGALLSPGDGFDDASIGAIFGGYYDDGASFATRCTGQQGGGDAIKVYMSSVNPDSQ